MLFAALGELLAALGAPLAAAGVLLAILEALFGFLTAPGAVSAAVRTLLGCSWHLSHPRSDLGRTRGGAIQGVRFFSLGQSWAALNWASLGNSWAALGPLVGAPSSSRFAATFS